MSAAIAQFCAVRREPQVSGGVSHVGVGKCAVNIRTDKVVQEVLKVGKVLVALVERLDGRVHVLGQADVVASGHGKQQRRLKRALLQAAGRNTLVSTSRSSRLCTSCLASVRCGCGARPGRVVRCGRDAAEVGQPTRYQSTPKSAPARRRAHLGQVVQERVRGRGASLAHLERSGMRVWTKPSPSRGEICGRSQRRTCRPGLGGLDACQGGQSPTLPRHADNVELRTVPPRRKRTAQAAVRRLTSVAATHRYWWCLPVDLAL